MSTTISCGLLVGLGITQNERLTRFLQMLRWEEERTVIKNLKGDDTQLFLDFAQQLLDGVFPRSLEPTCYRKACKLVDDLCGTARKFPTALFVTEGAVYHKLASGEAFGYLDLLCAGRPLLAVVFDIPLFYLPRALFLPVIALLVKRNNHEIPPEVGAANISIDSRVRIRFSRITGTELFRSEKLQKDSTVYTPRVRDSSIILIDDEGNAKLADFGLAGFINATTTESHGSQPSPRTEPGAKCSNQSSQFELSHGHDGRNDASQDGGYIVISKIQHGEQTGDLLRGQCPAKALSRLAG
ncbi:hypothetical protein K438DRAFT_1766229 [Mycena galopus ATCC 62051]|nr:hypothetical protein K438DRAFT_1766229 [Mycena galopus ATCC 62051]